MSQRNWKSGTVISVIAVAILLTIGLVWASGSTKSSADGKTDCSTSSTQPDTSCPATALSTDYTGTPAPASTGASTTSTLPVSQELIDLLTVTTVTSNCDAQATSGVVKFDVGALKDPGVTGGRFWGDALSVPLVAAQTGDPTATLQEFQANVCKDPLVGVTWANFFAHMTVGDVKVVDLNDWLKPFAVDPEQINDQAAGFILLDVKNPSDAQVHAAVDKNLEYQQLAAKLSTLMTRFLLGGFQSPPSVLNYHLTGSGLSVGGLPEVGLNPNQESLQALVLSVTEKGACVPIKVIGINVADQRPEEFAPPACVTPPAPPGTTPPPVTPTTTPTTHPGTTPSTTPNTVPLCPNGTQVPPNGLCPKDPSQDVLANPAVPPAVKGPGTTPVGVNPGPATPPVDSPTGCNGPCPTTVSQPTSTSAPAGSGTSGDGTPLPSGGNAGVSNPVAGIPSTTAVVVGVGDPGAP